MLTRDYQVSCSTQRKNATLDPNSTANRALVVMNTVISVAIAGTI